MMSLIRQTKESIARGGEEIVEQDIKNEALAEQIEAQELKQNQLRDQFGDVQEIYIKERDEPIRLGKGNDIISKGVVHLKAEMDKLANDKENVKTVLVKEKK